MTSRHRCLDETVLRAYLSGRLSDSRLLGIESELAGCAICLGRCDLIDRQLADQRWAAASHTDGLEYQCYANEPALESTIKRLVERHSRSTKQAAEPATATSSQLGVTAGASSPDAPGGETSNLWPSKLQTLAAQEFMTRLRSSGLLGATAVERLQCVCQEAFHLRPEPADGPATPIASAAQREFGLTDWQIDQLANGNTALLLDHGRYELRKQLGKGGMGAVYLARHRSMQRDVALKVIDPEKVGDPHFIARFQREVHAASRLEHPHIVAAYDAQTSEGIHYFVMQYVDGFDLAAILRESGPLPVAAAIDCIRQAALGLEYAHLRGVIHRDIKPANLLRDRDGTVRILDLGLARLEGDSVEKSALTSTGTVMGTVDFMAPEQARNTKTADARSDVYSLGMTLWYLLVGRPAFGGQALTERLLAHQNEPIPSLSAVRPDVPVELEVAFTRMVAKQPADRLQSMSDVVAALTACAQHASGPALLENASGRGRHSDSRNVSFDVAQREFSSSSTRLTVVGVEPRPNSTNVVQVGDATAGVRVRSHPDATQPLTRHPQPISRNRPSRVRRLLIGIGGALLGLCVIVVVSDRAFNHTPPAHTPEVPATNAVALVPSTSIEQSAPNASVNEPQSDVERRFAKWMSDRGFAVGIQTYAGGVEVISPGTPLPAEQFTVAFLRQTDTSVSRWSTTVDEGLELCRQLRAFSGGDLPPVNSDDWAAALARLPSVQAIDASDAQLTDRGLVELSRLPRLRTLELGRGCQITMPGLLQLSGAQNLRSLTLDQVAFNSGNGRYPLVDLQRLQNQLPMCRFSLTGGQRISGLLQPPQVGLGGEWPFDPPDGRAYSWSKPENLGANVNSSGRDMFPSLSEDETTLAYCTPSGIKIASRESIHVPFGPGELLPAAINQIPLRSDDVSITGDGLQIFFSAGEAFKARDIWMSERRSRAEPFGDPVRLPPPVNEPGVDQFPAISVDGLTLAVSSNRLDSPGALSVWFFRRDARSAQFVDPIRLGPEVNTHFGVAAAPDWISSDGRWLIASIQTGGTYELFWHGREAAGDTFSPGRPLYSPLDAIGRPVLSRDRKRIYFHSRQPSGGYGDLDLWTSERVLRDETTTPTLVKWPLPKTTPADIVRLLDLDVELTLRTGPETDLQLQRPDQPPTESGTVVGVRLRGREPATDDSTLKLLAGLKDIESLEFSAEASARCNVTPPGMSHLYSLRELRKLDLSGLDGDVALGVPLLKYTPQLQWIRLPRGDVADVWARMAALRRTLTSVNAERSDLSDAGLQCLERAWQLQSLNIVDNDRLSSAAVVHFAAAVPGCRIVWGTSQHRRIIEPLSKIVQSSNSPGAPD